jgi:hypothetical protein
MSAPQLLHPEKLPSGAAVEKLVENWACHDGLAVADDFATLVKAAVIVAKMSAVITAVILFTCIFSSPFRAVQLIWAVLPPRAPEGPDSQRCAPS